MSAQDGLPEWAKNTLRPQCPACGHYLLPCTATATGIHPREVGFLPTGGSISNVSGSDGD